MAQEKKPEEIAREAWGWYANAHKTYRATQNGSSDELVAIQAISLAAMTALYAETVAEQRKRANN